MNRVIPYNPSDRPPLGRRGTQLASAAAEAARSRLIRAARQEGILVDLARHRRRGFPLTIGGALPAKLRRLRPDLDLVALAEGKVCQAPLPPQWARERLELVVETLLPPVHRGKPRRAIDRLRRRRAVRKGAWALTQPAFGRRAHPAAGTGLGAQRAAWDEQTARKRAARRARREGASHVA